MRLLFDENLSRRLKVMLADIWPGSEHVVTLGMEAAPDPSIWQHARDSDFIIVTKDTDFANLSFLLGPPPLVVWLRLGNASTSTIAEAVPSNEADIRRRASQQGGSGILIIEP